MATGDLGKMVQLAYDWSERYGPVLQSQFLSQKLLFVTDPTLASRVRMQRTPSRGCSHALSAHSLNQPPVHQ
jgi:hypothetical protein